MAEIILPPSQIMTASDKEPLVSTREVVPENIDGLYATEGWRSSKKRPGKPKDNLENMPTFTVPKLPGNEIHPVLPSGDVFHDVVTHLKCQEIFALNVQSLITQYLTMQVELDNARKETREYQRKLGIAERQREDYRRKWEDAKEDLKDTQERLERKKVELEKTKNRLNEAVKELGETVEKLQKTKEELKQARRDLEALKREYEGLLKEMEFHHRRIRSLEADLTRANNGENAANDRNTDLTRMLYKVEADKSKLEREKDDLGARIRRLEEQIEDRHLMDDDVHITESQK